MAEDIASEATVRIEPGITYKVAMRITKRSTVRVQKCKLCIEKNQKEQEKGKKDICKINEGVWTYSSDSREVQSMNWAQQKA